MPITETHRPAAFGDLPTAMGLYSDLIEAETISPLLEKRFEVIANEMSTDAHRLILKYGEYQALVPDSTGQEPSTDLAPAHGVLERLEVVIPLLGNSLPAVSRAEGEAKLKIRPMVLEVEGQPQPWHRGYEVVVSTDQRTRRLFHLDGEDRPLLYDAGGKLVTNEKDYTGVWHALNETAAYLKNTRDVDTEAHDRPLVRLRPELEVGTSIS